MKQVRFAVFLVVALVVGAGVLLWSGLLTRPIVDAISKQLETDTEYKLTVGGATRVQFSPSLEVVADDVALAPTAGPRRDELLRVGQVQFDLSLDALLRGRVHAKEIALKKPVLRLVAEGEAPSPGAGKGTQADPLQNFAFERVKVEDGTLIYRDPRENAEIKVETSSLLPPRDRKRVRSTSTRVAAGASSRCAEWRSLARWRCWWPRNRPRLTFP